MECEKIIEMLPLYVENELNDLEVMEVEEHLNRCEKCRSEFKNLITLMENLKELPQLEVPAGLHESIIVKIKEEKKENAHKNGLKEKRLEKRTFKDWIVKHKALVSALSTAACFSIIWGISNSDMFRVNSYDSAAGTNGTMKQYVTEGHYLSSAKSESSYEFTAEAEIGDFMYTESSSLTENKETINIEETGNEKSKTENDLQKKIIKTADISMEVKDFDYNIEILKNITDDCGGYVEDFSSRISYKDTSKDIALKSGDITIKVPSEYYDEMIGQIEKLGDITQNREYVEDVTSQYVDTESLLKAKRLEEERLFTIMEKANTVDELIMIESRLGEIRSDIEVYTNRINNWDRLVKYSTININISQKREVTINVVSPKLGERISEGFINSVNTIKEFLENLVIFVISALPMVAVVAVLSGIIFLIVKLARKKKK